MSYAMIDPSGRPYEHTDNAPKCSWCREEKDFFYEEEPRWGFILCKECWIKYCDERYKVTVQKED